MAFTIDAAKIKKIAVIGAGPAGLAAAKSVLFTRLPIHVTNTLPRYLLAEKAFSEIVIFEQRLNVGGVWKATPSLKEDKNFTIPQTVPSLVPTEPAWDCVANANEEKFQFLSPIYDSLDTNIPYTLMSYSDHSFPEGIALFPRHEVVQEYLERYADGVRHLLRLGTQVLDVRPITEDGSKDKWSILTKDMKTGEVSVSLYDAVIVANGHYNDPYVPDIAGIREWNAAYPGSISHSKFYKRPDDFKDKVSPPQAYISHLLIHQQKVLIIGNSASGTDLAAQIAPHCTPPLLISSRSPPSQSLPPSSPFPTVSLPEITLFNARDRTIVFKNGHIEKDIDAIIFCTGYLYSYPFLTSLSPPVLALEGPEAGTRVQHLYQHIFYAPRPSLAFIAVLQRIVPFPLSEAQAAVVARVWSGRLKLPGTKEMEAWEREEMERQAREGRKNFHLFGYPADAEYINYLCGWAASAEGGNGIGKEPPRWGEEECWVRERVPLIKRMARELGPERRGEVRSLKELGFDFEAWKRGEKETLVIDGESGGDVNVDGVDGNEGDGQH